MNFVFFFCILTSNFYICEYSETVFIM